MSELINSLKNITSALKDLEEKLSTHAELMKKTGFTDTINFNDADSIDSKMKKVDDFLSNPLNIKLSEVEDMIEAVQKFHKICSERFKMRNLVKKISEGKMGSAELAEIIKEDPDMTKDDGIMEVLDRMKQTEAIKSIMKKYKTDHDPVEALEAVEKYKYKDDPYYQSVFKFLKKQVDLVNVLQEYKETGDMKKLIDGIDKLDFSQEIKFMIHMIAISIGSKMALANILSSIAPPPPPSD